MKIGIGADHAGFKLKQGLMAHYAGLGLDLIDYGTSSEESCDYPDIADVVCKDILSEKLDMGILICGTGIGISMAANRHHGIRAAILYSDFAAEVSRKDNNANVAVFGGRTMSLAEAVARFDIFRATKFEGGRHQRRVEKMDR